MLLKKKTLSSVRFFKALSFGKSLKLNGISYLTITLLTGVCCSLAYINLFELLSLGGNSYTIVISPWVLSGLLEFNWCFFCDFLTPVVVVTTISFLVSLYSIQDLKKKLFAFRLKETVYGLLTQIPIIKEDKPLEEHSDGECAALDLADSLVIVEPNYNGYYWVGGFLILALVLFLYLKPTSGHGGDTGQSAEYDSFFIQDNILDKVIDEPFNESWDTTPGSDFLCVRRMEEAALPSPQGFNVLSPEVQNFYVELTPKELDLICDQVSLSLSGEISQRWKDGFLTDSEYFELFNPFLLEAYIKHLELLSF